MVVPHLHQATHRHAQCDSKTITQQHVKYDRVPPTFSEVWQKVSKSHLVTEGIIHTSISVNSLAPVRSGCDSKNGIFNPVLLIGIFRSSHDNALRWMPHDLIDDKSTLVQVMAWCHQTTSHYLSQCWLRSLSPYGIARPQWVNTRRAGGQRPDQQWLTFHRQHFSVHFFNRILYVNKISLNCFC